MRLRRRRHVVCQQLVEMVTDYVEGDLDPLERAAVEEHLARCGHCTGYVQQVRAMLALTAGLSHADEVPDAIVDGLTALYRGRPRPPRPAPGDG